MCGRCLTKGRKFLRRNQGPPSLPEHLPQLLDDSPVFRIPGLIDILLGISFVVIELNIDQVCPVGSERLDEIKANILRVP